MPGVQQARPVAVVLHARRDKGSLAPILGYDEEDNEAKAVVGGNEDATRAFGMGGGVTEEAATQPMDAVAESYDEDLGGVNRTAVEGGADLTTVEESDEDETALDQDKAVRSLDRLFAGFECACAQDWLLALLFVFTCVLSELCAPPPSLLFLLLLLVVVFGRDVHQNDREEDILGFARVEGALPRPWAQGERYKGRTSGAPCKRAGVAAPAWVWVAVVVRCAVFGFSRVEGASG